ncbi:hypothetical protein DCS_02894 [Drechmeria coniospora]|uniref:Histidine phosphatase superfamily, clade-2 n=1 Tax=Drechmeria coniospora TaxID=98403 RepID=A0A151GXF4_DRECN|nr:hypothetical protein DCS_02894 [Drechmeria coniospora]KYK61751.1 hypothetical protein DCS_02894 [Drechmeria coniospora]
MIPASSRLVISSALLLAVAAVSADDGDNVRVWAAVAYVNHGESTPLLGGLQTVLTPEGAQQMQRQGIAFRSRYLNNGTQIQGINVVAIDNLQLNISSQTDDWVAASALAFMQGLYPPDVMALLAAGGGTDLGLNLVAGSNTTDYPLLGYQYPRVRTLSNETSASLGNVQSQINDNRPFYENLFSSDPLKGFVTPAQATYLNAYELYDLVNYQYRHNGTVFKELQDANKTIDTLQVNAYNLEQDKAIHDANKKDDPLNALYSIAGRTLAYEVEDKLNGIVARKGGGVKISLMFGSFRPLLSFLTIAGLLTTENLASGPFSRLPEPGATMIFELVSDMSSSNSDVFPPTDKLKVRFYYRSTANANDVFTSFALFGAGSDQTSVPYSSFVKSMEDRSTSPTSWCSVCKPDAPASWCAGLSGNRSSSRRSTSPFVAGLIGAATMAGLVAIATLVLWMLGRLRFQRPHKKADSDNIYTPRGFQGEMRKASDADVAVSGHGEHKERVGSWEMQSGEQVNRQPRETEAEDETEAEEAEEVAVTQSFHHATSRIEDDEAFNVDWTAVHAREGV